MQRVLLINPPQTYSERSFDYGLYFPIGLMSLAANVRDLCDVSIFDCLLAEDEVTRMSDELICYGAHTETLTKAISHEKPDLIGVSVPFTAQYGNARRTIQTCREAAPNVPIVVGGPDPSVRYREILDEGVGDYCVVGEGEVTFREMIQAFLSSKPMDGIPGVASRRHGTVHLERRPYLLDLDQLEPPAMDLVDVEAYRNSEFLYRNRSQLTKNSISILTSRGCPYDCVFCSIGLHMGKRYRYHSPEYVMKLIRSYIEDYGITNFHFEDDNLSLHRRRFDRLLDAMIQSGLKFRWDTPNGLRADALNREMLEKMKKTGCKRVILAFESGSQRVLDEVIKKNANLEYMKEIARECYEIGIPTRIFFVIGFPGESLDEMKQTIELALELLEKHGSFPSLMVATPLYGTELYEMVMEHGYVDHPPTAEELGAATQVYGNPMISTPEWSNEDVRQLLSEYRRRVKKARWRAAARHPRFAPDLVSKKVKRAFGKWTRPRTGISK